MHKWIFKGPFTKLFMKFLTSKGPICSKIQTLGYIFSYYAMAAGLPFSMMNYLLVGWYNGYFDLFYDGGWRTFLSILVVFSLSVSRLMQTPSTRLLTESLGERLPGGAPLPPRRKESDRRTNRKLQVASLLYDLPRRPLVPS